MNLREMRMKADPRAMTLDEAVDIVRQYMFDDHEGSDVQDIILKRDSEWVQKGATFYFAMLILAEKELT